MTIIGAQARAARALIRLPRDHVARTAGLDEDTLRAFETGDANLDTDTLHRLRVALEAGGAVFLPETREGGIGVRLKFPAKDVRAIDGLENEGGAYGSDDV